MVVKYLHAGNIAVVIGSVATAADVTVTGGAGAAIATALSSVELFKKADKNEKALAKELADAYDTHIANSHLSADRAKIVRQLIARFPMSLTDMARGGKVADLVATVVCERIEKETTDSAKKSVTALGDYRSLLANTLVPFLEPQDDKDAMLQELLRRTTINDDAKRMHDLGVNETSLIELAQRTATDTQDLEGAWAELQNVMEIAVRVQEDGHKTSNHGDFVDEVMRRVAEFAAEGEYTSASAKIAEALGDEVAASEARQLHLIGKGIDIALLDGDSVGAAKLLVRNADMEAGGQVAFGDIRALQESYYLTGRDKGIALDLKVSIHLAQITLDRATIADERGTALNDLAISLRTLGERDSDTVRLEQAVEAYQRALEERTQDRVPMNWAATQNNLGVVELAFFDKNGLSKHLDRAQDYADAAHGVFEAAGASHYLAVVQGQRDAITARWAAIA